MTTQVCKQCGAEKDLYASFYKHPSCATGHMTVCKKCHRENVAANAELKRDPYRITKRAWSARPENVAKRKAYRQTERGRVVHRASNRVYMRFKRLESRA